MVSHMKMKKLTISHFQKCWKRRTSTGAVTMFLHIWFLYVFLGGNKAVQFNCSAHGLCPQCRHRRIRKSDHLVEAELQLWQKVLSGGHSQPTGPTRPTGPSWKIKYDEIMQSCIYALLDSEKCGNTDSKNWPWEDWTPQVRGWNNTCLLIDRIWTWALHLEPFKGGSSGNWCATLCFGTRLPAKEHRRLIISNACLLKCIRRDHGWLATNICAWTPQAERGFS